MNTTPISELKIDLVATGGRIYDLRIKAGLTVPQLKEIAGVSNSSMIYEWQNGYRCPSAIFLLKLSRVFGVPIEDILVLEKRCFDD